MVTETAALVAEVWYETAPDLTDPSLLAALRQIAPGAEAQQDSITVPFGDNDPPLLTVIMAATPLGEQGKRRPEVSQTWDWPEAEEAVARCSASLLVTEMLTEGWSAQDRVSALTGALVNLCQQTKAVAVHWPHSQRVCDPELLEVDDLAGIVNVRFFDVSGDEEAMVLDTLGLYVFGLPDLQCHFRGREPGKIAALLYATAVYVFDEGDVILDGNTISGLEPDERYVCRRETSLLQPSRPVLDVDLGSPYAAGSRE
jgi:hypothetical protein